VGSSGDDCKYINISVIFHFPSSFYFLSSLRFSVTRLRIELLILTDTRHLQLHGRTRQQRYDRVADWAYIKTCVDAVRAKEADDGTPRIPLFGGGDAFSAQDYWEKVDASGVDGVMLARGALIKPWLFTEVKERREWDISATERLGFIRRVCLSFDIGMVKKLDRLTCVSYSTQSTG
jgi:tRNA-dihydrouridine synthase